VFRRGRSSPLRARSRSTGSRQDRQACAALFRGATTRVTLFSAPATRRTGLADDLSERPLCAPSLLRKVDERTTDLAKPAQLVRSAAEASSTGNIDTIVEQSDGYLTWQLLSKQRGPFCRSHQLQSLRNEANDVFSLKFREHARNGFVCKPRKSAISLRGIGNGTRFERTPATPGSCAQLMMNSASLCSALPRPSRSMWSRAALVSRNEASTSVHKTGFACRNPRNGTLKNREAETWLTASTEYLYRSETGSPRKSPGNAKSTICCVHHEASCKDAQCRASACKR